MTEPPEIVVRPEDREIVRTILARHLPPETKVWVFGSRARGDRVRRGSDLDLAVDAGTELTIRMQALLADDFLESLLPYTVDVLDLQIVSPSFKKLIEPDFVSFPLSAHPRSDAPQTADAGS